MKKSIWLLIAVSLWCMIAHGQENKNNEPKTSVWFGPQVSIPVGDLGKSQSIGIGASAEIMHKVGPNTSLGGRLGYTYLFGKSYSSSYSTDYGGGSYTYGTSGKYKPVNDITIS